MKKHLFIIVMLSFVLGTPLVVHAQNVLDPARLAIIRQNCPDIQTILDQLQRRDLVARTNRGRAYEAQIKQIDALDQRFQTNNIATPTVDPFIRQFKSRVDSFRTVYVQYDDRMTVLRQTDCRDKPDAFANLLEEVRILRQEVGVEVLKGEETLAQYRQALVDLRGTLPDARGPAL